MRDEVKEAIYVFAGLAVGVGSVLLVFFAGFRIVRNTARTVPESELSSLLLAAASLGVLVLSVVVTLAGIVGWRGLRAYTERRVEEELENVQREFAVTLRGSLGVLYGRVARNETEDDIKIPKEDELLLAEALEYTRKALRRTEDEENRKLLKNNLAFYLALEGDPANARFAKELAVELRDLYSRTGDPDYLDTWAQVVLTYPDEFSEELGGRCEAYRKAKCSCLSGGGWAGDRKRQS